MQVRTLPAVRGAFWIVAGFQLYRRHPPLLIMLTLGYLFLVVALGQLQPIGPFLLPLALPTLTVLVANGCRALGSGKPLPLPRSTLTVGLREHGRSLLHLGGLNLLGTLAILAIDLVLQGGNGSALVSGNEETSSTGRLDDAELLWHMLRLLLIALPVLLAFWFAPLLTAWEGAPAAKALFFSMIAVWRNWRAFLVYALTVTLIGVFLPGLLLLFSGLFSKSLTEMLSVALRMVLFLVLAPVLMTSIYLSFRDVFAPDPATEPVPDAP